MDKIITAYNCRHARSWYLRLVLRDAAIVLRSKDAASEYSETGTGIELVDMNVYSPVK